MITLRSGEVLWAHDRRSLERISENGDMFAEVAYVLWPHVASRTLPCWPNVIEVNCISSIGLITLPNWPNVRIVRCDDCIRLTNLPNWSKIVELYCNECPALVDIPNFSTLECIECSGCSAISSLPDWPVIKRLRCDKCPLITALPSWPTLEYIAYNTYQVTNTPFWSKLHRSSLKLPSSPLARSTYSARPKTLRPVNGSRPMSKSAPQLFQSAEPSDWISTMKRIFLNKLIKKSKIKNE